MAPSRVLAAAALLVLLCPGPARASRLPDLDPNTTRIVSMFASVPPDARIDGVPYFDAPIPRRVHQIWYGPDAAMCPEGPTLWRAFADLFGYGHRLWTEADDAEVQALMPPQSFVLLQRLRAGGMYRAASDILRLTLLDALGGIYSDIDIGPPLHDEALVDLAHIVPMRGLVLLTENFARNVGSSAVFFANGLMAASPGQPLIRHLVAQLPRNVRGQVPAAGRGQGPLHLDAHMEPLLTGPFLLNRSLGGVMTVLPITVARRYRMVRDGKWDAEQDAPFSFDEVAGAERWGCEASGAEAAPR